ncbi:MAG: BMP family protein [Anaerolineae bacterium]|nr:BMP family protein [Anaerolineae bacterium]
MKTALKTIYLIVIFALLVTACAPKPTEAPTAAPKTEEGKPLKVALVLGGVITDNGFGAAAYRGLMSAQEEYGVETAYSESVPLAEYENAIRDYANKGFDLIIGHGSEFGDALKIVSEEFPDTYFAGTNCFVKGPNLAGLDTKQEEAGFIMGVVAGQITKAKKIGWVGAKEILSMKRDNYGFGEGVKAVCPDCEVMTTWVGAFDDVNKGKENALALIDKGADVLVHNADAAGLGVLAAAKEKNVLAIGNVGDQKDQAPDQVVTSMIRAVSPVVKSIVGEVVSGNFKANTIRVYGFAEGLYYLTDFNTKLITPEQIKVTNEWIEKIKAGQVPLEHIVP